MMGSALTHTAPAGAITMTRIFHVNGKTIDVTDRAAVQALTADEYADLLKQTLQDTTDQEPIVGLTQQQPADGTAFVVLPHPPGRSDDDDH